MGRSPRCYISSFVEVDLPAPVQKIFEGVFTIYGHDGHLGYVISIISTHFYLHVPKSLHTKYGKNAPVVSEESMFKCSYINGLG